MIALLSKAGIMTMQCYRSVAKAMIRHPEEADVKKQKARS